jgi:hypothetical protein
VRHGSFAIAVLLKLNCRQTEVRPTLVNNNRPTPRFRVNADSKWDKVT